MKTSTLATAFLVVASQFFSALAADDEAKQEPKKTPVLNTPTSQGCYLSSGNLTDSTLTATQVSSGSCIKYCKSKSFAVVGLGPETCKCGNAYPPKGKLTDDKKCDAPCPAYGLEACGSIENESWSIWNTGIQLSVPYFEEEEDKASSSTSSLPAATSTDSGKPSATNDPATSESSSPDEKDDSGPSIGPIVGGVVAGVVVVCGVVGGLFFFMRRRRNSEIEEEYRRNAAVNAFISGSKPPGSSAGSISMTDSRLDPIKAHRLSDGSIADNEDYSRKILRVTNA